jgi:hypothetical protein
MATRGTANDASIALTGATASGAVVDGLAPVGGRLGGFVERLGELRSTTLGARAGYAALAAVVLGVIAVVVFSTAGNSILVPRSGVAFPSWEAGPLRGLFARPNLTPAQMTAGYSALVVALLGAYLVAVLASRALSLRVIVAVVVVLNLLLLLGPPLQLNDVFNYLGYARLGALHHLNPYTHVMTAESYDPVYRFSSWRNYASPYGQLFTVMTYPLAWMPLPVAYWLVKIVTVLAGLAFLWVLVRCARMLGRDPRTVLVLVAINPIYLFFLVGAFHNDFFMLLPATAAIALLLARRDRAAGAVLMLAVAIKFTAVLLLPFLLIAARPPERRLRVLTGVVLAGIPLLLMSVALFGFTMPNVGDQSSLITGYSIPNLLGLLLGLGGSTPTLLRVLDLGLVLIVLWGLRRADWVAAAGWATVALVASLSWLMPWYVVWALPLAALGHSPRLRRVTLAFSAFLVLCFVPETGQFLSAHGIDPMNTPQGQAAEAYQSKLQGH